MRIHETADCPRLRSVLAGALDETRYVSQLWVTNSLYCYLKIVACVCRKILTCIDAMMESPCREAIGRMTSDQGFFTEPQCNNSLQQCLGGGTTGEHAKIFLYKPKQSFFNIIKYKTNVL